jgi:hypothetical protein
MLIRTTEAFILLSGALVFTIEAERFEATENSFVHIPQGVIHTYANTGVQPAKALVVFFPAGRVGWFRDVLHRIGNEGVTPYASTARELDNDRGWAEVNPGLSFLAPSGQALRAVPMALNTYFR